MDNKSGVPKAKPGKLNIFLRGKASQNSQRSDPSTASRLQSG